MLRYTQSVCGIPVIVTRDLVDVVWLLLLLLSHLLYQDLVYQYIDSETKSIDDAISLNPIATRTEPNNDRVVRRILQNNWY